MPAALRCGDWIGDVSGLDLGVWQQHHSLAGGWWGGAIGPLAALAALCGRGRRRLDRWQEASGDATAEGCGDATNGPQGQRHRQDRPLYSEPEPSVMPSRELLRHGADASATRSFAISTSCPSPTQTTQERERATAGKYVLVNPDRVN
jgi:hypothetical protein